MRRALLRLVLLVALPALTGCSGYGGGAGAGGEGPWFGAQVTAARAAEGRDATLTCTVSNQGDKQVSWVRSRDLQILSHAGAVFTADTRVSASASDVTPPGDVTRTRHQLRIAFARPSDAGRYECQLNTEPKMSLFFNLTVTDETEPEWRILVRTWAETPGAQVSEAPEADRTGVLDVEAAVGGAVTLACEARHEPAGDPALMPLDIRWFIDDKPFDLQAQSIRGGVSLETQRLSLLTSSRLTLTSLTSTDAARYSCRATAPDQDESSAADITLHVLDYLDNHIEAMQRDQSAAVTSSVAGGGAIFLPLAALLAPLVLAPLTLATLS